MSLEQLRVIAGFLERSVCPEDVFGNLPDNSEEHLKTTYRQLAKALHPDSHVGDLAAATLANDLFLQLETFHQEAIRRLKSGSYGNREPLPHKAPIILKRKYVVDRLVCVGDISDVYYSSLESSGKRETMLLKVVRKDDDNDLLRAEASALERLHQRLSPAWATCVPTLLESFLMDDGGPKRRVNVLSRFDGFLDGEEIIKRLPKGVDGRTLAWMWKRLLVLMDWSHKIGLVHGAILPPHVMFYPDNDGGKARDVRKHSIRLVDWCYSVDFEKRTRLSAWVPSYKHLYAPEILAKEKLGPWTDLYMGAATMMYLGGVHFGEKYTGNDPDKEKILSSIYECLYPDPSKRPQDILKYFRQFTSLLKSIYGAPKFHEFKVPKP